MPREAPVTRAVFPESAVMGLSQLDIEACRRLRLDRLAKFLPLRRSREMAASQMAADSRRRLAAPMRGTGRPPIRKAPGTDRGNRDLHPGRRSAGRSAGSA